MIKSIEKVGFGGSCHWCTEAIFQALRGVHSVKQGYISASPPNERLSEAVLLEFDPAEITLATLIEVHLRTHSCTSSHVLREKYRSAVYVFDEEQATNARQAITLLQAGFDDPIITRVLAFRKFEASPERYQNYYQTDPNRPFCQANIDPKLKFIRERFGAHTRSRTSQC